MRSFVYFLISIAQSILEGCRAPGRHYFYGYWNNPDHQMHESGVDAPEITAIMRELDAAAEALASGLTEDTLLLFTADHGLVNGEMLYIEDHPALAEALVRPPAVEPRAAALYVKPEYRAAFPELFERAFPGRFLLMTGREAVDSGLFGPGDRHPRVYQNAGDYMALSLDSACLKWAREDHALVGVHAGLTAAEMRVPLIVAAPGEER